MRGFDSPDATTLSTYCRDGDYRGVAQDAMFYFKEIYYV